MLGRTTPQELAYWLQGFFEITDAKVLTTSQVQIIKNKVASCFEKATFKSELPKQIPPDSFYINRGRNSCGNIDIFPPLQIKNPLQEISVC